MRLALCVVSLALLTGSASASDWPHWRGPMRDGISPEPSGYQNGRWNVAKPAWRSNVGKGGSSPIAVGDKLYTLGWKDGKDVVACLDAATGKEVWSQKYACPLF